LDRKYSIHIPFVESIQKSTSVTCQDITVVLAAAADMAGKKWPSVFCFYMYRPLFDADASGRSLLLLSPCRLLLSF
jgi:hypothetical protein